MKKRQLYILPMLLILIGGCAQFSEKPLLPENRLDEFQSRTLTDSNLCSFVENTFPDKKYPPEKWDINSLTLAAVYYHPELDTYRQRYLTSKAEIGIEKEYPNPTLSLVPAFNSTTTSADGISPWLFGITLDIPLQIGSKRDLRISLKKMQAEIEFLNLSQNAWQRRNLVYQAMLNLYITELKINLLQTQYDLHSKYLEITQQQVSAGLISDFQAYQIRNDRDSAYYSLLEMKRQGQLARSDLAESIGIPVLAIDNITLDFAQLTQIPEDIPAEQAQRQSLLNRSDVLVAMEQYKQSQVELQYQIALQFPDIRIGPGYEFDQDQNKWSFGVSVALPVFNQNQAAIKVARQKRDEMAARFEAVQAAAIQAMDRTVKDYSNCIEKYKLAKALVKEKEQTLLKLQNIQTAGQISMQQVLLGKLESNQARQLEYDALADVLTCIGKIEDQMQTSADFVQSQKAVMSVRQQNENKE